MDDFLKKSQKSTAMQHWQLQQGFPGHCSVQSISGHCSAQSITISGHCSVQSISGHCSVQIRVSVDIVLLKKYGNYMVQTTVTIYYKVPSDENAVSGRTLSLVSISDITGAAG